MSVVGTLLGAYAAFAGLALLGQRKLLYPAPKRGDVPSMQDASLTEIPGQDGRKVRAFFVPPPPGAPTVVHFHGNGEELGDLVPMAWAFRRSGLGFFAVEYPGYGLSREYSPNESAIYSDAERALWHLQNGLGVDPKAVVLQGQSLGSGVAVEMAKRGHGVRIVLISPFTSVPDVAARLVPVLPVRWLMQDRFDNLSKAKELKLPVLIVHGTEDTLIPVAMGKRLAEAFPNASLMLIEGGQHNDLFVQSGRRVMDGIAAFAQGEYRGGLNALP